MPKLKERPEQAFYNSLTKDIQKRMIDMGMSRQDVSERACMKYRTFCHRLKEPDTWILNELLAVLGVLKLDYLRRSDANAKD